MTIKFLVRSLLTFALLFLTGCFFQADEVQLFNFDQSAAGGQSDPNAKPPLVTSVQVINDRIVVSGQALGKVDNVNLNGPGVNTNLTIFAKSTNQLILTNPTALALAMGASFTLNVSNAHGSGAVSVIFNVQDGSITTAKIADGQITGAKISTAGASTGNVLQYNGSTWAPADLSSLVYSGTWDASTATAPNTGSPTGGEFYIVDTGATVDIGDGNGSRTWNVGDWIVYNAGGTDWDKIDNSNNVTSFNGRAGAVVPTLGLISR
jgi:hypothetical protein